MAEYIERGELYRKIAELEMLARGRYLDTPTNSPVYPRYMAQMEERTKLKFLVADFPAADVVEIVRCKDCAYCEKNECTYPWNGVEEKIPEISKYYRIRVFPKVKEDHFCSYGERKEQ